MSYKSCLCWFFSLTWPLFSSSFAFLCSEKQQNTRPLWTGLSLQLTKVLMSRGIVRECFVHTALPPSLLWSVWSQMYCICVALAHIIIPRRKHLHGVEAIVLCWLLDTCGTICLYVCFLYQMLGVLTWVPRKDPRVCFRPSQALCTCRYL